MLDCICRSISIHTQLLTNHCRSYTWDTEIRSVSLTMHYTSISRKTSPFNLPETDPLNLEASLSLVLPPEISFHFSPNSQIKKQNLSSLLFVTCCFFFFSLLSELIFYTTWVKLSELTVSNLLRPSSILNIQLTFHD